MYMRHCRTLMQKHQAHVLGLCTVFGIFIIVLYLFSGNNIDRKGLSIIVFLFIWTKLVLSHNSPCLIIPTLTLYFKSQSSTDEGDHEDEGAWIHKVALTKTLHICTKSSAKPFRNEAKLH